MVFQFSLPLSVHRFAWLAWSGAHRTLVTPFTYDRLVYRSIFSFSPRGERKRERESESECFIFLSQRVEKKEKRAAKLVAEQNSVTCARDGKSKSWSVIALVTLQGTRQVDSRGQSSTAIMKRTQTHIRLQAKCHGECVNVAVTAKRPNTPTQDTLKERNCVCVSIT